MLCEDCKKERPVYKKRTWTWDAPNKRKDEDLLTYYLRCQDAKKRCLNQDRENFFHLPVSDSVIRGRWKMLSLQSLVISDIKIL